MRCMVSMNMLGALTLSMLLNRSPIRPELNSRLQTESNPPPVGVVDCGPLTDSILVVHNRDGYVVHHKIGQKRSDETVVRPHPLDVSAAANAENYSLSSPYDADYAAARHPLKVVAEIEGHRLCLVRGFLGERRSGEQSPRLHGRALALFATPDSAQTREDLSGCVEVDWV